MADLHLPSHRTPDEASSTSIQDSRMAESSRLQREQANNDLPLLKLPPELRNEIYALALPSNEHFTTAAEDEAWFPFDIQFEHSKPQATYEYGFEGTAQTFRTIRTSESFQRYFSLTQVCRQIRADTIEMAYEPNTFSLHIPPDSGETIPEQWIRTRPSRVRSAITKISLTTVPLLQLKCGFDFRSLSISFDLQTGAIVFSFNMTDDGCGQCFDEIRESSQDQFGDMLKRVLWTSSPESRVWDLIQEFREYISDGGESFDGWNMSEVYMDL